MKRTFATNMSKEEIIEFLNNFIIDSVEGKVYNLTPQRKTTPFTEAGGICDNRCVIERNGFVMKRYQMIFFHVNEYLPSLIDHIDKNSINDEIDNLRDASHSTNRYNSAISKRNKLGITGVGSKRAGYFIAYISTMTLYKGHDLFEACCARKSAENTYFKY